MNEDLNAQVAQMLADVKVVVDNQNKILATLPNAEVLKNELSSKVDNDKFKPILDAMNLHLSQKSLARNGYAKLPNGLMLQWGEFNPPTANISTTVYYPVSFNTTCLFVNTCGNAETGIPLAPPIKVTNAYFTTSPCGVRNDGIVDGTYRARSYFYFAIGY